MAIKDPLSSKPGVVDKQELLRILDAMDREAGFEYDATATAEKARTLALEDGVRPQVNLHSSEIIRLRYAEDRG